MTSFDDPPFPSSGRGTNGPDGSQWKRIVPMRRAARDSAGEAGAGGGGSSSSSSSSRVVPPPPSTSTRRASSSSSSLVGRKNAAPMILSLFLLITLAVQVALVSHHENAIVARDYYAGTTNNHRDVATNFGIGVVRRRRERGGRGRGEEEEEEEEEGHGGGNDGDGIEEDNGMDAIRRRRPSRDDGYDREGGGGGRRQEKKNYTEYSMDPIDILRRADIDHTSGFIPSITGRELRLAKKLNKVDSLIREVELPTVDEITSMYGSRPYIAGLERCGGYVASTDPEKRIMGPAGLFNSATNLLEKLLSLNCVNTARESVSHKRRYKIGRKGIANTAPWGKHNPVSWRYHHETKSMSGQGIDHSDFLPIVMIKDPITWMASMCRHQYESRWAHHPGHCPNLVPNKYDRKARKSGADTIELMVKFATKHLGDGPRPDNANRTFVNYTSLVDMWNVWYGEWRDVDFPRLMVRFEDLLFHAEEVVSKVCECGGGTMAYDFRYVEGSAKGEGGPHAGSAGFLASLVTYGNSTLRMKGILTDANDVEYARMHLDKDLMEMFGYAPI